MSKYSEKQVSDKIEEARLYLAASKNSYNEYTKCSDLHCALECVAAAYNMLTNVLIDVSLRLGKNDTQIQDS